MVVRKTSRKKIIPREFGDDHEASHPCLRHESRFICDPLVEQKFSELTSQDIDAIIEVFRLLDSWDQRRKAVEGETSQSRGFSKKK